MTCPRLEIDLAKISHNAELLVTRLGKRGISVSGVTKAFLGLPEIAETLLAIGVAGLADSRIENFATMRRAGVTAPTILIRSPMIGQARLVVGTVDASVNTELDVISALSKAAQAKKLTHGVLLMVELGDLREGIMPTDLETVVRRTLQFPNIKFLGIGANLACRSGVVPDDLNMGELSNLADAIDAKFGPVISVVSGGSSANLDWALGTAEPGRINNLRLGEAILLGREPLHRRPIDGLFSDAITLVAEVIEAKIKPAQPWGDVAEAAFGPVVAQNGTGSIYQAILALGQMDTDPQGLTPPAGIEIVGSSSDHLVLAANKNLPPVGTELKFAVNYSALIRSMASPFVAKLIKRGTEPTPKI